MSGGGIGIRSVAYFLPETVRTNDWWPAECVSEWGSGGGKQIALDRALESVPLSDGQRLTLSGIRETADDPFQGARRRHVLAVGQRTTDMEVRAARAALTRHPIEASDVGFLLTHTGTPDHLGTNEACVVHHQLALSQHCVSFPIEGACNSFLLQLDTARCLLRDQPEQLALLVQSSTGSRVLDPSQSHSPYFGDGASAVVVGHVREGLGILSFAHRTLGQLADNLVIDVPFGHWYEGGQPRLHWQDRAAGSQLLLAIADLGRDVVLDALRAAALRPSEVNFFAGHQGTVWLRSVLQRHVGLESARFVDTFADHGNLSAVNLPLILALGEQRGLLAEGDIVLAFSGGSGVTLSAAVMRWGG